MLKILGRYFDFCMSYSKMTNNCLQPMDPIWSLLIILTIKGPLHCKYSELIYRQTKVFICCFNIKMNILAF